MTELKNNGIIEDIRGNLNSIKTTVCSRMVSYTLGDLYFNDALDILNYLNDVDEWLYDLEEKDYNKEDK